MLIYKIGSVAFELDDDNKGDESWIMKSKKNDVVLFGIVLWEFLAGGRYVEDDDDVDEM